MALFRCDFLVWPIMYFVYPDWYENRRRIQSCFLRNQSHDTVSRFQTVFSKQFALVLVSHRKRLIIFHLTLPNNKNSQHNLTMVMMKPVTQISMIHNPTIGSSDVLLGRGGATNNHIGNRRFRTVVADHQAEYLSSKKKEKVLISKRIVAIIKSKGGRFLKRDTTGIWVEVPEKRAIEKTSQALREGLDVRNHTVRPKKQVRRFTSEETKEVPNSVVPGWVMPSSSVQQVPAVIPALMGLQGLGKQQPIGKSFYQRPLPTQPAGQGGFYQV